MSLLARASIIALVFACGCQHRSGTTSVKFVDPAAQPERADARKLKIKISTDVYVDAKPIEPLAAPNYPPRALAAKIGDITITVKITVGKNGRVEAINPSWAAINIPTPFDGDFHEAIQTAVGLWRFEPATIATLQPTKDGPPVVTAITEIERDFDVAFTFSPSGKVSVK